MPTADTDPLAPYARAAAQHGGTFEATLWKNKDMQRVRFDTLIDGLDLAGATVLDVGCGLADLASRLAERGVTPGKYIGVEGIPELAASARKRNLPSVTIVEADFARDRTLFDRLTTEHGSAAVVFSGSLNTFTVEGAMAVLARAWDAGATQMGFNFLSTVGATPGEDTTPATRMDPIDYLTWALRRTPLVSLRQDYLGAHDATVCLKRTE